jgi:DNA polymerase-3 subunit delta'
LLKRALKINWGAPLLSQQWLQVEDFKFESEWQQDLKNLKSGQKSISQLVTSWQKHIQPEVVFDYFYLWCVNHIRSASYQNKIPLDNRWFKFQNSVMQAKQLWYRNANKEMLLENTGLDWLAMVTDSKLEFKTTYNPNWIRGLL